MIAACTIPSSRPPFVHAPSTNWRTPVSAKILSIPVYVTTQNKSRLGDTCSELDLSTARAVADKTAFSMLVPEITSHILNQASPYSSQGGEKQNVPLYTDAGANPLSSSEPKASYNPVEAIIVGIETHICVTQTALDLLEMGHKVYVLADGVVCNLRVHPAYMP